MFMERLTAWIADFFCRIASLKALLLVHIFRGLSEVSEGVGKLDFRGQTASAES